MLPPPYMVDSLANGHVDGFCVGAPWNSVAVDLGIGVILHFVSEILQRAAEKVLAVRAGWAEENPDVLLRLVRAHRRAAAFIEDEANREEVAASLPRPTACVARSGVPTAGCAECSPHARWPPEGRARRHRAHRASAICWSAATALRGPIVRQAAWLYAQMVRWGQAPLSQELLAVAKGVVRPDLYDAALPGQDDLVGGEPADGIGAFAGPTFDAVRHRRTPRALVDQTLRR